MIDLGSIFIFMIFATFGCLVFTDTVTAKDLLIGEWIMFGTILIIVAIGRLFVGK